MPAINHYLININRMQEAAVNRIIQLLITQQKGEITEQEQQELDTWATASTANQQFIQRCLDQQQVAVSLEQMDKIDEETAWQRWLEKNTNSVPVIPMRRKKPLQWVAAAVTVGVLATGAYLYFGRETKQPAQQQVVTVDKGEHIQPGSNKATLTLGDGRTIVLDEKKDGVLANEGGAAVNKKGDALVYAPETKTGSQMGIKGAVSYHTVATPRGGNYALVLPDKSKVWLNAEASIRYPTAFTGKERRVEVTGEAYFEVAKKADQPFIVDILSAAGGDKGGQVKVLGTHFNIRAYGDESVIKTTLLEGRVEVADEGDRKVVLQPEQQTSLSFQSNSAAKIPVQTVDVESVVAWKNGYFDFKAASLPDILKEVKRWYQDVEAIDMQTTITDQFTAGVPRNVPLSTMLTILEETNRVHFEMKGKTLVVTK